MRYEKYRDSRYWAVYDDSDELICLTVYRKGAAEIVRRLEYSPCNEAITRTVSKTSEEKKLLSDIQTASKQIRRLAKELLLI